jgi:hypothetical protein
LLVVSGHWAFLRGEKGKGKKGKGIWSHLKSVEEKRKYFFLFPFPFPPLAWALGIGHWESVFPIPLSPLLKKPLFKFPLTTNY